MAATKSRSTTPAKVEHAPPPSGCAFHERADWLSGLPDDLPWLAGLRAKHLKLAHEWADAVDAIAEVRWQHTERERQYRQAVRDALATGSTAPPRPTDLDSALRDGAVEIAVEDAKAKRDELSLAVVATLAALRSNRADVDLANLDERLVRSLCAGGANAAAAITEATRRELAHLEEPAIEVVSELGPTPDLDQSGVAA